MLLRSNACVMSPFVGITYSFVFSPHIYNKQKENIMFTTQQTKYIVEDTFSLWLDFKVIKINSMFKYINSK